VSALREEHDAGGARTIAAACWSCELEEILAKKFECEDHPRRVVLVVCLTPTHPHLCHPPPLFPPFVPRSVLSAGTFSLRPSGTSSLWPSEILVSLRGTSRSLARSPSASPHPLPHVRGTTASPLAIATSSINRRNPTWVAHNQLADFNLAA